MSRAHAARVFLLLTAWGMSICPAYATEKAPDEWMAKAYYNRGTAHYNKGEYDAAIKNLSKAVHLEPNAPDVYYNRGLSYRRQHQIDAALSDFSKAIQLNSTQPSYYFERCNARVVKNDLEGAISDCSEVIQLSPDNAGAYLMRGVASMLKNDFNGALADCIQALHIDPGYQDARRLMFETLLKREASHYRGHSITPGNNALENLQPSMFSSEKS